MNVPTPESRADLYSAQGHFQEVVGKDSALGVSTAQIIKIDMGTPVVGDVDGYLDDLDLTALGVLETHATVTAGLAAGVLAGTADVPRNVVAAWTGTAIMTITGTDVYGNTMTESSASGTSMTGKKAFKTVTGVSVSANVTAMSVGTGDVLGIPYVLTDESDVLAFYADTTEEKLASVFVGAVATDPATATTGDVRGTVNPNTTLNGSVQLYLWMSVRDTSTTRGLKGVTQA